jgi:hypothetical protein
MQDPKNQPRALADIAQRPVREASMPTVAPGFGSLQSFELMQRAAKMLAHSTLVPVAYRATKEIKEYGKVVGYEENPSALPNCVVALNMAQRMGADTLAVMQNLYIVEGRPSWSSQFIIAAINSCGRYSPLRFDISELGEPKTITYTATEWVKVQGQKDQRKEMQKAIVIRPRTCVAWAIELATGDRLESPVVSMDMAVAEGWLQKNGSKWQTMPDVMLRYRAAAFFGKLYAPELLMGLQTAEEAADIIDVERGPDGKYGMPTPLGELRESGAPEATEQAATIEQDDGGAPAEQQPGQVDPGQDAAVEQPAVAAEAGTESASKPAPITPEQSETYERMMTQLNRASSLNQLMDVYGQVDDSLPQALRTALMTLYQQRYDEFQPRQANAPAPRARRSRGTQAGNVE